MNPNIYVSCIKKFWTTVAVKKVNAVTRLQALVDKKKVVVTEATIRDALRLDDAEGVECLLNEEIFVELARMGYEKPSTKLTFYKAFFSSYLVRNVDSPTKFYMDPRFLQLMIRKQVGKGFFGVETPLFEGMIVEQQVAKGDADEMHGEDANAAGVVTKRVVSAADDVVQTADEEPSIPSSTPPTLPPQPSHDIPSTSQVQPTPPQSSQGGIIENIDADEDVVLEDAKDVDADAKDDQVANVLSMREEESKPIKLQEVVDVVTTAKIITEVVTAASTTITVADVPIHAATTAATPTLIAAPSRRTKAVVIRDPEESTTTSTIIHSEAKSKDKF
nr:hypothetical protein [Tanacetum cinerariifolium]